MDLPGGALRSSSFWLQSSVLIVTEKGYGNTRTILNNISKREDFKIALELYENGTLSQPIEQPDVSEYYDANELLKNAIS